MRSFTGFPVFFKIAVAIFLRSGHEDASLKQAVSSRQSRCLAATVVAIVAVFAALTPAAWSQVAGYVVVSSYSGDDTGLHASTFDTVQDNRGVLYFGGKGVLRFDGDRWQTLRVADSFAVRSLNFGPDGRLWAGTIGDLGWFEETADHYWIFKSLRSYLPPEAGNIGEVWGVLADEEGATFVSYSHVLRWDGRRIAVWRAIPGSKLIPCRANGTLYVNIPAQGLFELERSGPRLVLAAALLPGSVMWLERHGNGWLFATRQGLFICDGERTVPYGFGAMQFLAGDSLTCACRLPDGRIALGTASHGIGFIRPDGSLESTLGDPDAIPSPFITSLFVSQDAELWATTGSHIVRIDTRTRSTIFDSRAGLPRQTYRKIALARGHVFVANESGVYELSAHANRFEPISSLTGRWRQLRFARGGLFASGHKGVTFAGPNGTYSVFETMFDVYASTEVPGTDELFVFDATTIQRVFADGTSQPVVKDTVDLATSLEVDPSGTIWFGTLARGVFVATPERDQVVSATRPDSALGLPKIAGSSFVRIAPTGAITVCAENGAWFKATSANRFTAIPAFPARVIGAVSNPLRDGSIWVAFASTPTLPAVVGRISVHDGNPRWEYHSIEDLAVVGSPSSLAVDDSDPDKPVMWLGGTHAVLRHLIPTHLQVEPPRPPLLRAFARTARDGTRHAIHGPLDFGTESVEFEFAAPQFSRRSQLRIQSRIEGIDTDWVTSPLGAARELSAVRDGRFNIRARVVAETGIVSEETSFSFEVLPPWWRTRLAFGLWGAASVGLVFGFYRLRVRAWNRRNAELEEKVRQRTEELVAANAAKTQFVANMSHDIRNPLNGIVGLALALEDTRLNPRQQEIVATLRECTTYLSSLVDDVLDFASIEAGKVELRPRAFRPQELLQSIVETLKTDAMASGATLIVEPSTDAPLNVVGDAGRIQQILVNFVSNALKYAGGQITLSARARPATPGEVEFSVRDEGPGLSTEQQATLFTKFSRLHQKRGGEEIPGTGLGLAACRLLADIMGGAVGVESRPDEGSRFFLRLPLALAGEMPGAAAENLPNTTVLLVEDTDYNAWAASAVLAKLGLGCERARTGAEALEMFRARRFNVVLLDRNLPDMDGTEVARRIRALETEGSQALLLAVTAYCTADDRELCLRAGMDAFVGKPITPEKLRNVLIAAGRRLLAAASVHAMPEIPAVALDTSLLSFLSDGSAEGLQTQIDRFLASITELENEIADASKQRDFDRLRAGAHRLLGQARMVGADALATSASELEAAARANDDARCASALRQAQDETRRVTAAMRYRPAAAPTA